MIAIVANVPAVAKPQHDSTSTSVCFRSSLTSAVLDAYQLLTLCRPKVRERGVRMKSLLAAENVERIGGEGVPMPGSPYSDHD